MASPPPAGRSPWAFLALLLGLAVPIWALSAFVGVVGSLKIPVTDLLLAFTPLTAGAILVARTEGPSGLAAYVRRAVDFRRLTQTVWVLPVVLLAPLLDVLTVVVLRLAGHAGVTEVHPLRLAILAPIMFVLAIGEEAGWTGYLTDPLQSRYGALGASLIIAVPWWLGHIPSILQIGGGLGDLAVWFPGAIALRILMTWLYNNTGRCVAAAVVFHTLLNVGRSVAYPGAGTHYDPAYQAVGYGLTALAALVVVLVWGPGRLVRTRAFSGRGRR